MIAWILTRLKWLGLLLALSPLVVGYFTYDDAATENYYLKDGKDAVATIVGATKTTGRRRGTSFSANLAWRDDKGQERRAEKVTISSGLADKIFADNTIVRDRIKIRYISDDPTAVPLVIEDRVLQARDPVRAVVDMLPLLVPLSLVGGALFFALWRAGRRKTA